MRAHRPDHCPECGQHLRAETTALWLIVLAAVEAALLLAVLLP